MGSFLLLQVFVIFIYYSLLVFQLSCYYNQKITGSKRYKHTYWYTSNWDKKACFSPYRIYQIAICENMMWQDIRFETLLLHLSLFSSYFRSWNQCIILLVNQSILSIWYVYILLCPLKSTEWLMEPECVLRSFWHIEPEIDSFQEFLLYLKSTEV